MSRLFKVLVVKKLLVTLLITCLFTHEQVSYAQALPAANFVVNRAIAGAVTKVAASRGFAANDPRIVSTLAGIGEVSTSLNVASTAAGVGMAIAGAPVWMGIAASLGVVAVGYGVNAWVNGSNGEVQQAQVKLASTPSGNVIQVDAPAKSLPSYTAPQVVDTTPRWAQAVTLGGPIYRSPGNCYANETCYVLPLPPDQPSFRYSADWEGKTLLVTADLNQFGQWYTFLKQPVLNFPPGVIFTWQFAGAQLYPNSTGGNQITVSINESLIGGDQQGLQSYSRTNTYNNAGQLYGQIGPQYYPDLNQAYSQIPEQVKTAKVSNDTLARIVDQAWQRAAMKPSYQGMPYTYSQPVTEIDVAPWAAENPLSVPTIRDLMTPANNPGSNIVPISPTVTPGTSTSPGSDPSTGTSGNVNVVNTPNVNVVNQIKVDLGVDPNVQTPNLEPTPTAHQILSPLLNLMPDMRHYVVPAHSSECPKPSFELFGRAILMDGHCTLLSGVAPTLYAVMAGVWSLIAVFVVLAA